MSESPAATLGEGVIETDLRRATASLRAIRIGRWNTWVTAAFIVILFATQMMGFIDAMGFLIFYTIVCAATVIPYVLWLRSRERRLLAECAACRKMLEDLRETA